jgi:hypothetical protein
MRQTQQGIVELIFGAQTLAYIHNMRLLDMYSVLARNTLSRISTTRKEKKGFMSFIP